VPGAGRAADLRAQLGQRRPVGNAELAQQRGDVALHGPHRDMQSAGDLAVAQPRGDRGQHLGLAFGHPGASQPFAHTAPVTRHGAIVQQLGSVRYGRGIRSKIRRLHG
jgi:hypothetical protein